MKKPDLQSIINSLKLDYCEKSDYQSAFASCHRIAFVFLKKRSSSYNFEKFLDRDLNDLSLEIIEPLFLKNQNDGKLEIVRSFEHLRSEIQSESHLNYLLHKIVWHRAEQQLTTILKEQDPVFARILKNLHYLLKKQGLKKLSYFGKVYIVRNNVENIDSKVIDEDIFEQIPFDIISAKKDNIFENLFNHIENEFGYFPAVPLISLAKRLKKSIAQDYKNSYSSSASNDGYELIRINELVEIGLEKSISHLNNFYLAHKKLSCSEGALFFKGLEDIAEDAKDGGIGRGLFEYLFRHKNDLTREEFQSKYYQPFEYLVRIFKNAVAGELRDTDHNKNK